MFTKIALKYSIGFGMLAFFFSNFIACGARMYQVSLEQDHDASKIPRHASQKGSVYFGIHATDGWHTLPIRFKVSHELSKLQQKGLLRAMKTWEIAVGKKLFHFEGVDQESGDTFNDLYSSLDDDTNGHYLDNDWDKTGKSEMVLATTIWTNNRNNIDEITTADIRFNSMHYMITNSFNSDQKPEDYREIVDMETLALHELGHLLGLSHVEETDDRNSIMNPSLYIGEGLANRTLSFNDVKRIQKIYSCSADACDLDLVMQTLSKRDRNTEADENKYFASQYDDLPTEDKDENEQNLNR